MPTNLQIPTPCAEEWTAMKTSGFDCRFCAACQRNIMDFTQKTDAEILAHVRRNEGRICGRFRADQLNRPLIGAQTQRRVGLAAIAAGFAAILSAQQPMQGQKAPEIVIEAEQMSTQPVEKTTTPDSLHIFSGQVLDAVSGEPVIGCAILLKSADCGNCGLTTNMEGRFSFEISRARLSKNPVTMVISYTGYIQESVLLTATSQATDLQVILLQPAYLEELQGLVGIIGVVTRRPTFRERLHHFFHPNQ